jgi:hypothetical protein
MSQFIGYARTVDPVEKDKAGTPVYGYSSLQLDPATHIVHLAPAMSVTEAEAAFRIDARAHVIRTTDKVVVAEVVESNSFGGWSYVAKQSFIDSLTALRPARVDTPGISNPYGHSRWNRSRSFAAG